MTEDNINLLNQIYSALANISTKGEDTLIMADCLRAIGQILQGASVAKAPVAEEVE